MHTIILSIRAYSKRTNLICNIIKRFQKSRETLTLNRWGKFSERLEKIETLNEDLKKKEDIITSFEEERRHICRFEEDRLVIDLRLSKSIMQLGRDQKFIL